MACRLLPLRWPRAQLYTHRGEQLHFRRDWIEEYLIDWIDMDYAPEHYSQGQLDGLTGLLRDGSLTICVALRPRKNSEELVTLENERSSPTIKRKEGQITKKAPARKGPGLNSNAGPGASDDVTISFHRYHTLTLD
jgi:hypothetical protein